ncbi:Bacteriophage T7 tail fibre protein [uncultured Caudovirales phage]|uniref:Bacteriophage T7 tail fibre protein n=1 Tax=uncultured Caudovirales phage TaxID=2100421 RepID=A0A6J7WAD9_9CAUD|nr:Bacteriophage T7 tail fibre protein [uncultured Caudovirales phage]
MAVSSSTTRADYTGNGVTTAFTIPFYFVDNSHVVVLSTVIATGAVTTLAIGTDYSLSGAGSPSGGTATLVAAPAATAKIAIYRNVPFTQVYHYVNGDTFPASAHEANLDLLCMESQQLNEAVSRSLQLPVQSTGVSAQLPTPESGKVLAWNSAATGIQNLDISTLATIVSYGTAASQLFNGDGVATAFTLASNPGSQANLDVAISGVTQRAGVDFTWTSGTTVTFTSAPAAGTNNVHIRYMQALAQNQVAGMTFSAYGPTSIMYGSGGNLSVSSGSPTSGPGGNAYDGGILTHQPTGDYQVSAYQVAATSGALPAWGPVSEFVARGTYDQATNFSRISLTAMAPYAGPALNDGADDFRIQQEASGTVAIKPFKITSQKNSTGWYLEYLDCLPGGNLQLFRRTDSPAPTGANLALILGQDKRALSNVLTAAGTQDSPSVQLYGNSYDSALHSVNWRQYVSVLTNAGSSKYRIQSQVDSAGWVNRLSIDDGGGLTDLTSVTFPTLTPTNGTVTVSSLSAHAGGTFTPALQFGGATTGITYSAQIGRFQRTGNRVYFEIRMALSSKGSATGTATIAGLPFTTLNLSGMVWSASFAGNNYAAGVSNLISTISAGVTAVSLQKFAAGAISNMAETDFTNTSTLTITGTYEV